MATKTEKAATALREALEEYDAFDDTWVTSDDKYVGLALTAEEAYSLAEVMSRDTQD